MANEMYSRAQLLRVSVFVSFCIFAKTENPFLMFEMCSHKRNTKSSLQFQFSVHFICHFAMEIVSVFCFFFSFYCTSFSVSSVESDTFVEWNEHFATSDEGEQNKKKTF